MKANAILVICFLCLLGGTVNAQTFNERMDDWPLDLKINGRIMAGSGDGMDENHLVNFLRFAGGEEAKLISIGLQDDSKDLVQSAWGDVASHESIETTGLVEFAAANEKDSSKMEQATGVWISLPASLDREHRKALKQIEPSLRALIQRGGVLFTSAAVTQMLGKHQIMGGQMLGDRNQASIGTGLHLIPDVVIQNRFAETWQQNQLLGVLASHPRCIGIGMEPNTTLVLQGRKIRALGQGKLHFLTTANDRSPVRRKTIGMPETRRVDPYQYMVDLTAWRRDAIDRTLEAFPAAKPETPFVENGTLLIVGGGGMPDGLMAEFIELAGGENARLVYIPCSERDEVTRRDSRTVQVWKQQGVASAHVIHTKDRNKANSDEEFLEPLKNATGIFFGGGRQWNFSDSYYGTKAHRLMKNVLERGGVIAGSSAGASIQGRYLARANPLGNIDIMATGYERGGLGFISGVAIDQHFTQRGRQPDMSSLVNRYPQLLGIGIDETTAIVVKKSIAKVVGKGEVFFYDRGQTSADDDPDYIALSAGSTFDLAKRVVVEQDSKD